MLNPMTSTQLDVTVRTLNPSVSVIDTRGEINAAAQTMLADARRRGQKLLAYGLSEHYRRIFALTRLDEAIRVFTDEASTVMAGT
jgi:hypothetical protein